MIAAQADAAASDATHIWRLSGETGGYGSAYDGSTGANGPVYEYDPTGKIGGLATLTGATQQELRRKWIEQGAKWFSRATNSPANGLATELEE